MSVKENPFVLAFGEMPEIMLDAESRSKLIINDIKASRPNFRNFMISGLRGSGKTVLLRSIQESLGHDKDYIFVTLDMGDGKTKNLLHQFAAILATLPGMKAHYTKAEVTLSIGLADISLKNNNPFIDTRTEISKMLGVLKDMNKKIIIMLDEVLNIDGLAEFISAYKELTNDYPVYLVMAGLKENTDEIKNNPVNTFIRRAYPIELEGLDINKIEEQYKNILEVDEAKAKQLAKLTQSYSFAFQALGYAYFEYGADHFLEEYDKLLELFVYKPLWDRLSAKDKQILVGMNTILQEGAGTGKTADILSACGLKKNEFSPYRKRLSNSTIIDIKSLGIIKYNYPRFDVFVTKEASYL